mmetsp:Transcript_164/g.416  ORF Transcript_164/g.416 Transcript_164/m.416 type:complete len:211 (-) Transcript_164:273-905(-)
MEYLLGFSSQVFNFHMEMYLLSCCRILLGTAVSGKTGVRSRFGVFSHESRIPTQIPNIKISNIRIRKIRSFHIRTLKTSRRQHRILKNSSLQTTPLKRRPIHNSIRKIRPLEIRIPQIPLRKLRLLKIRPRDIGLGHDDPAEIVFGRFGVAEVAFAEIVEFVAGGVGLAHFGGGEGASRFVGVVDGGEFEVFGLSVGVGGERGEEEKGGG